MHALTDVGEVVALVIEEFDNDRGHITNEEEFVACFSCFVVLYHWERARFTSMLIVVL